MIEPYYADDTLTLWHGDALTVLTQLPAESVDCCVTSPPYYGLRDYGSDGQYGLEPTPADYVDTMRAVFAEVRRVLADDGTLWLNLGDSYTSGTGSRNADFNDRQGRSRGKGRQETQNQHRPPTAGMPPKNLVGIPWRVAFALQADGWTLRNDLIWHKANAMPESVTDRLANRHEYIFMLTKSRRYWFDLAPIRERYDGDRAPSRRARTGATNKPNSIATEWQPPRTPRGAPDGVMPDRGSVPAHEDGRNPGDVWTLATQPFSDAHFAVMPSTLAARCIMAGCRPGGTVLDPFSGSGTTGLAAARHGRAYVGIDLSADYLDMSLRTRLHQMSLLDGGTTA